MGDLCCGAHCSRCGCHARRGLCQTCNQGALGWSIGGNPHPHRVARGHGDGLTIRIFHLAQVHRAVALRVNDLDPVAHGKAVFHRDFGKASIDAFYDGQPEQREMLDHRCCAVSMGRISLDAHFTHLNQFRVAGGTDFTLVTQGDEKVFVSQAPSLEIAPIATAALRNAASALQEIMLLNDPETFILESTPLSAVNPKPVKLKPGQIRRVPRTHERPTYTVLRPHEIRERMKLAFDRAGIVVPMLMRPMPGTPGSGGTTPSRPGG